MIGRTSGASRFNIDKFSEVLGLCGMKRIVSEGDDFVVDTLFYFNSMLISMLLFLFYANLFASKYQDLYTSVKFDMAEMGVVRSDIDSSVLDHGFTNDCIVTFKEVSSKFW